MEDSMSKIIEMLANLTAKVMELTDRVYELETRGISEGVYLDGVPNYAKKFILKDEEVK
jgi:hypothetical protein